MEEQGIKDKEQKENFRYFVRIANTDLDGNKRISHALTSIKGVGFMFANMLCNLANIDKMAKVGYLSDEQIKKFDEILSDPTKYKVPSWMLNRRKGYEDGKDRHFVTSDLAFAQDNDIKIMKKIRSYRGIRHGMGLPVRGQRTKSNFRKNKGKVTLGVKKREDSKAGRV
ncbi:30S ribosomal protein S13 [Candidatus Woesearchaeota archaeon]|nr:30S ribosomal protein S13 [Candidatus Woesearchaeota archaeon]